MIVSTMYGPLSNHGPVRSTGPAHSDATPVGTHEPPVQTSPVEQALPSSHRSVLGKPTHAPPLQTSPLVHALSSSQGFVLPTCVHVPVALQTSSVQRFPSLKHGWPAGAAEPRHAPPVQTSPLVHGFPSSQAFVLGTCVDVPPALPASPVQPLPFAAQGVPACTRRPAVHAQPDKTC